MLTGEARIKFEDWYLKNHNCSLEFFYSRLVNSMQFGVYQDFADSIKIEIRTRVNHLNGLFVCIFGHSYNSEHYTREEARLKAIEKLNDLINE